MERATSGTITAAQVLDELAYLATVEHALCVDYLLLHYAFRTVASPGAAVIEAIDATISMAQNAEMHHLARVNRVLVGAGRSPVLERADHVVVPSGAAVALGTLNPGRFDRFPDREKAVAAVVDARYARLRERVAASGELFDPTVQGHLMFAIDSAAGHAVRVETLGAALEDVDVAELLEGIPAAPADDGQRDLLALSDVYYRTVVDAVRAGLAHPELEGQLLSVATTTMGDLDQVNVLLATQGLVPAFDLP